MNEISYIDDPKVEQILETEKITYDFISKRW